MHHSKQNNGSINDGQYNKIDDDAAMPHHFYSNFRTSDFSHIIRTVWRCDDNTIKYLW